MTPQAELLYFEAEPVNQTPEQVDYEAEKSIIAWGSSYCRSGIITAAQAGFLADVDEAEICDDLARMNPGGGRYSITTQEIREIVSAARPSRPVERKNDTPPDYQQTNQQTIKPAEPVKEAKQEPVKAESSDVDSVVAELNKEHAAIIVSGKFLILNQVTDPTTGLPDINFSSVPDFKNRYQNTLTTRTLPDGKYVACTFAEKWLTSPDRKSYKGIVFDPSGKQQDGIFNLWQGFALKPIKGQWKRMERHILEVICSNDRIVFNYVMAWLARLVQDPGGNRPGVVIVLRGKQGTGKGIFVNNFGKIFGQHYKHIISHNLLSGRFNSHFKDGLFVFIDEAFWGGNKEAEGALKGMITEQFIHVEPKGREPFQIKNHCNFVFASNNSWVCPADTEERRFFVIDVSDSHMGDAGYFRAIADEMDNGGREAMLYDLLNHNITGIDLLAFPRREALLDQIMQTWPADKQFWYEALRAGCFESGCFDTSWPDDIECKKLYGLYLEFSTAMGVRFKSTDKVFGKKFRELCPKVSRKQKGDGKNYYFLPSLSDCRNSLETLLKMEKGIDWDEEI